MFLGHRSNLMVKTLGDKSMIEKRGMGEHARPIALQGPRDMVKAGLLEPQTPEMELHILRHGMYGRCRRDRTVRLSPFELSSRRATTNEVVQGAEQGTYVALLRSTGADTGSPLGREAPWRRSGRSSRRAGKPPTWRRTAGALTTRAER